MKVSEVCELEVFEGVDEFSEDVKKAIEESRLVLNRAHAPYSGFQVSAVLVFEDGSTSSGTNQENPSFPSGLCAERVALFHATSEYPSKKITHLVISTRDSEDKSHPFAPPCGACLQVIDDVEHRQKAPIQIILCGLKEYYRASGVRQFLPFRFEF